MDAGLRPWARKDRSSEETVDASPWFVPKPFVGCNPAEVAAVAPAEGTFGTASAVKTLADTAEVVDTTATADPSMISARAMVTHIATRGLPAGTPRPRRRLYAMVGANGSR
jgi:hypothetical protein